MVARIVAHALVRWIDPRGRRRLATHGQTIELDEHTAAELDKLGATIPVIDTADEDETSAPADPESDPDTEASRLREAFPERPDRPKQTAPKHVWAAYALALGIPEDQIEALDKRAIIAAVTTHEQDPTHG